MGNCFTLAYVFHETLARENKSLLEFSRFIDESDEFLDHFFLDFEVEAPDDLVEKVISKAKML
jgi:hypothetical protein